jgi:hypothetical protein
MRVRIFAVAGLLAAAACNSSYIYQPEERATAQILGRVAADYPLPTQQVQKGDARVASFGIAKVKRNDGTNLRAVHVRMVVSNNSGLPFRFNTGEQRVDMRGGGQLTAAFVRSDGQDIPNVTVPPGGKRTVDLFYALPPGIQSASKLPQFDFTWRVDVAGEIVAQRTPFQRLAIEPVYAYAGWGPYWWGPYGWYDPLWGPVAIGMPGWYW